LSKTALFAVLSKTTLFVVLSKCRQYMHPNCRHVTTQTYKHTIRGAIKLLFVCAEYVAQVDALWDEVATELEGEVQDQDQDQEQDG
jgi:hypothetical protein